jgi:hypothetical protein
VFTPLELGTVGLSEDEAIKQYGADCIGKKRTRVTDFVESLQSNTLYTYTYAYA